VNPRTDFKIFNLQLMFVIAFFTSVNTFSEVDSEKSGSVTSLISDMEDKWDVTVKM